VKITSAEFVISNTDIEKCPPPKYPEYAFIGRSNVGKSSLINMLCNKKALAKTSATPGKTQLINHFVVNAKTEPWYIVDLPGYGYAKAPKKLASKWMNFSKHYLRSRRNLMCVMVLLDSRHTVQKADQEFMEWLGENRVPFTMVFTKLDKLSSSDVTKNITSYKKKMLNKWESLPKSFNTSSETGHGRDFVLDFIDETNKLFEEPEY